MPYRIREYERVLENCYDTIIFDHELHRKIEDEVGKHGSDARLLHDNLGDVIHVTFLEKLLVLLLAKLANLVPEGGIWMNTQRPEWNDANNALAGKGLSVVAAGYLRRFVVFLRSFFARPTGVRFTVSEEVARFLHGIEATLGQHRSGLGGHFTDGRRRQVMDALGSLASSYRWGIYRNGFSGDSVEVSDDELTRFLDLAGRFIEHTLRANQRPDGLYHAYNTLCMESGAAAIDHLWFLP